MILSICTLIFVSGGKGGMSGLSHALVPAQESKKEVVRRLSPLPVIQKSRFFWARKNQEKLGTQIRASPVSCQDAVCVKVASSLTFGAYSSLQSFSTSEKMKGPKTEERPLSILRGSTFGSLLKYISPCLQKSADFRQPAMHLRTWHH